MKNMLWDPEFSGYTYTPSNELLRGEQVQEVREFVRNIDIFVGFGTKLLELLSLSDKEAKIVSFDITPGLFMQMLIALYYDLNPNTSLFFSKRKESYLTDSTSEPDEYERFKDFAHDFASTYFNDNSYLRNQILDNLDELLPNLINSTRVWADVYSSNRSIYYEHILDSDRRKRIIKAIYEKRIRFMPIDVRIEYKIMETEIRNLPQSDICLYVSNTLEYIKTCLGEEDPCDWLHRVIAENESIKVGIVSGIGVVYNPVTFESPDLCLSASRAFRFEVKKFREIGQQIES